MAKPVTKVVFRKWPKSEGGGILALFPELPGTSEYDMDSFEINGGHGAASTDLVSRTKAAAPSEYAETKRVLERNYGYRLRVVCKIPGRSIEARRKAMGRISNPIPIGRSKSCEIRKLPGGKYQVRI